MATRPTLAQCPRCKGYCLVVTISGIGFALSMTGVGRDDYVQGLVRRTPLFDLVRVAGSPSAARRRLAGTPAPSFDPLGAQIDADGVTVVVEHGCGAQARDMKIVEVAGPGKGSAPATHGSRWDGSPRPAVLAGAPSAHAPRFPASSVTHPPSDTQVFGKCGVCDKMIRPGEIHWSITHGHLWIAGEHEECP